MIEILRLNHRINRDKRVSTHCALVARAFGADKLYYSGEKDSGFEDSVNNVVERFGGDFKVEYCKNPLAFVKEKKNKFVIINLTMYGINLNKEIRKLKGDILVIIGGEKVPIEYYNEADYNIAIGNQPHSEIAALVILLYELNNRKFKGFKGKVNVIPMKKGKLLK